jgi:hypothetical protein
VRVGSFDTGPVFAIDCLRRPYALERFPVPVRVVNGEKVHLRESDLVALSVALRAVAVLTDGGTEGTSWLRIEDLAVKAVVTPRRATSTRQCPT